MTAHFFFCAGRVDGALLLAFHLWQALLSFGHFFCVFAFWRFALGKRCMLPLADVSPVMGGSLLTFVFAVSQCLPFRILPFRVPPFAFHICRFMCVCRFALDGRFVIAFSYLAFRLFLAFRIIWRFPFLGDGGVCVCRLGSSL